jgi:hypothetical protein
MKATKHDAKTLLRKALERRLARQPYISVATVRNDLAKAGGTAQPATLNRYLAEFTRAGLIHDAGRGWYSSVATQEEIKIVEESSK